LANTWNNAAKTLVEAAVSFIPVTGGAAAILLGAIWPDSPPASLWDEIKGQVLALVDKEILNAEMEDRRLDLEALKTIMQEYTGIPQADHGLRGQELLNLITCIELLRPKFTESNNRIHLLPMAAPFALLHLTVLKERYRFGATLYGGQVDPNWLNLLKDEIKRYKAFFPAVYQEWRTWRASQITNSLSIDGGSSTVSDFVTMQKFHWKGPNSNVATNLITATTARIFNDVNAQMVHRIWPVAYINESSILDGVKSAEPLISMLPLGPYSGPTMKSMDDYDNLGGWKSSSKPDHQDYPGTGEIISVEGYADKNFLWSVQFKYRGYDGNMVGYQGGSSVLQVVKIDGLLVKILCRFDGDDLSKLEFYGRMRSCMVTLATTRAPWPSRLGSTMLTQ